MARHDPYKANGISYRILRFLYRRADRIVRLTEGTRRELVQNFSVPEQMVSALGTNAVVSAGGGEGS